MTLSVFDESFWDRVPAEFLRPLVVQGRENGLATSIFALGDPTKATTPGIAVIHGSPGHLFPRHCHDCERFEVVVDGGFTDALGNSYRTGDVMVAHHMDMYGPHLAGPDGYIVVEYFGSVLGTYELFWETRKGPLKANKLDEWVDSLAGSRDGVVASPVVGTPPPPSPAVERGAAHESVGEAGFWNKVPAPYLQPLVDHTLASGYAGMAYRMFALGDPFDPETPAAVVFHAPAGYVLPRHSHDCHRFEVMLEGSITNERGEVLTRGSIMTAEPDEMYGPMTAGPDGYTSVEYFSNLRSTYEICWDTPKGPWHDNRLTAPMPGPR